MWEKKKDYGGQISNFIGILLGQRGALQSTYSDAGLTTTTLHMNVKAVNLCCHNNTIKSLLSEEKKLRRIEFSTSFVDLRRDIYLDNIDVIHVDEKLFYTTNNMRRFYLELG